ncbi:hypothetical protein B23_1976 [Geobacillus thermoleovorans B23]|nr:hypothetical protein B23_1976 [Geobacillus thermoleovorans B23]
MGQPKEALQTFKGNRLIERKNWWKTVLSLG